MNGDWKPWWDSRASKKTSLEGITFHFSVIDVGTFNNRSGLPHEMPPAINAGFQQSRLSVMQRWAGQGAPPGNQS